MLLLSLPRIAVANQQANLSLSHDDATVCQVNCPENDQQLRLSARTLQQQQQQHQLSHPVHKLINKKIIFRITNFSLLLSVSVNVN